MFACLHVFDFPVQAALRLEPEHLRERLSRAPLVLVDGPASLLRVVATNWAARAAGIEAGMTKLEVETCGPVEMRKRYIENENIAQAALLDCALEFSPVVESTAPGTVLLNLAGTEKLFGSPRHIGKTITRRARDLGFELNIGVAADPDTAMCAARGFERITFIPAGEEAKYLASLPIEVLETPTSARGPQNALCVLGQKTGQMWGTPSPEIREALDGWGVRNFGSLAALPPIPLSERLGQEGLRLQQLARGGTRRSLVPYEPAENFWASFEFDDPIETLESLGFILNRLVGELCARLASRSLAARELRLKLELEARQICTGGENRETYEHVWKPPLPTSDAKFLAHLASLDLSAVTFSAPIKKVSLEVVPTKPRAAQGALFAPPSPESEQLEITLARLRGVVGSRDKAGIPCVGTPKVLDSHQPDSFTVQAFSTAPKDPDLRPSERKTSARWGPLPKPGRCGAPATFVLRRFRPPLETSVELTGDEPHIVLLGKKPCRVAAASGPWRSSGHWWNQSSEWARDEWDVALNLPTGTGLYRIYLDRLQGRWWVEGMFD